MRIAFFTDTFPPEVNGVANTAASTAKALTARGHAVTVFAVSRLSKQELSKETDGTYEIETIPSIRLPIYLGVRAMLPLGFALRKVARFKPNILHAHTPFSVGWEAVWAARFLGVPLVGTHHTFFNHYLKHVHLDYRWAKHLSWKLTVGYYNRCDCVVSPTRSLAEELIANGLKRPHEVIPNGIDTALFSPASHVQELKTRLGLSKKVVVHMGRLSYEKSIDQAIRAFQCIAREIPDATFIIIGDGPGRADLEVLVRNLKLEERVRFTGFLYSKELVEYLQASDVFVTASKSENMPLAILEAMSVGLPVVAVKSLGLAEMIEEGKNGYLVPPDDIDALSKHMLMLLHDTDLKASFSAVSRSLSEKYSEATMAARLEGMYARLIESRVRP